MSQQQDSAAHLFQLTSNLRDAVSSVIVGKSEQVRLAVTVLLAGGHLLMEDVPGVGKTVLAKTLARAMDSKVSRIQFTPDMLPSDVTGVAVYDQRTSKFEFQPGPVFANIVIGDEINRASPKTQSALLECMEERQVSVDGATHLLPDPFTVVATQNPSEMEGTYPLPEAQRDRFMARLSMGYPDRSAELSMLESRDRVDPLSQLQPQVTAAQMRAMIAQVQEVYVAASIKGYVVELARSTREHAAVRVGVSPRASLHLLRAAKAAAAVAGRGYVIPDDVRELVVPVFAHRLVLGARGRQASSYAEAERVLGEIIARVPAPTGA
ncbi:AAA family ATPase [Gulosibacter faecalis]|jgi:MoxR-like ATPase|uniref:AAA family ATPase n=1 Tax=Gulosibacter faecalis TaxID=272240 RepID=A0ABW5UXJ8_9MICO|nr:MoxR family ATPase [Gulosibacter faecalis]